jgi:hypothetical protein
MPVRDQVINYLLEEDRQCPCSVILLVPACSLFRGEVMSWVGRDYHRCRSPIGSRICACVYPVQVRVRRSTNGMAPQDKGSTNYLFRLICAPFRRFKLSAAEQGNRLPT